MSSPRKILALFLIWLSGCCIASTGKVEALVREISRLTGLPGPASIRILFVTSAELEDAYWQDFMVRHPQQALQEEGRLLRLAGLCRQEPDLAGQFKKIINGNIKAYYRHEPGQLLIDRSIPFEDEYSLGSLIAQIRILLVRQIMPARVYRGRFFCDENWLDYALLAGDASFAMHQHYGENADVLASMDGMSLISRDPLVSAADSYQVDPLFGRFFSQGLILGVQSAQAVFRKKDWKSLNQRLRSPPADLTAFLLPRHDKGMPRPRTPQLAALQGFQRVYGDRLGLFLTAEFLERPMQELAVGLGFGGDCLSIDKDDGNQADLLQWKACWKDEQTARDAYLILRDRCEVRLGCRFQDGTRSEKAFQAGRDLCGAYIFIRHDRQDTLMVRSFDRNTINRFIQTGRY